MTETTSKTITANIGGRSPLSDHGILGDKGDTGVLYASWPMALARAELKPAAKAVAALIWSHTEGWEISIAALAEDSGMSRNTVGKAVDELQAARWLVRQPYGKPGKKPAGEVWHRQLTNVPFTEDEVRELSTLVPIGTGAQKLLTPGAQKVSTGGAQKVSTKVVDLPVVDLQAVQASVSSDAEPVVVAEKTAGDKKEPSSLPVVEEPLSDDLESEIQAFADNLPDHIPMMMRLDAARHKLEGERDHARRVAELPEWFTPELQEEATSKGKNLFIFARDIEAGAKYSKVGYARSELAKLSPSPAGRLWQE